MAPADSEAEQTEACNRRTVRYLVAGFACWMFGAQLTRASQVELLLSTFNGDTVAMAKLTGRVSTMSAVIGIFVNPVIGSLADAFGRRAVLLAGAVFSVVRPACWLLSPGVTGFVVAETVAPIAQVCAILPPQAAVADMYNHDKVQLASRQSLLFLVPAVCQIVCPILGGILAAFRVLLPFAIATGTALASGVVSYAMSEPLPKDRRKPFSWAASTPLSALTLFARGRYMRCLAILQVLMDLSETSGRPDRGAAALVELHQKELGWGVLDRNSWRSMCGVIRSPGNLAVAGFTAMLGTQSALSLGFVNYTLQALLYGLTTSKRLHFILSGTFFFNPLRLNVLTGAMAQHAPAVGLSQGQLRGAVTNLGSLVSIFAGLVWPRIYAVGVKMGRPGLFYLPIALVAMLQLLIVRTEMGPTN